MRVSFRPGTFAALAAALAAPVGCGGGGTYGVYPVRGKVLVDGRPAERVVVTLYPSGGAGGRRSMATTEADGSFQVTTSARYDGVPPGEYAVTLVWPEYTADGDPGPDRLKGRYAAPARPFTKVVVQPQATQLEPFEVRQ